MNKSESIKELAAALSAFQSEVLPVKKDANNPFFKSKYADLASIIEAVRPVLAKNGLAFSQFPENENQLTTLLTHTSGEWLSATYTMQPIDQRPQSLGSALTYQRRYALGAVLGIATEDDDDGNTASGAHTSAKAKTTTSSSLPKPVTTTTAAVISAATLYLTKMRGAKTAEDLEQLGKDIAADTALSDVQRATLRSAYATRLLEVQ